MTFNTAPALAAAFFALDATSLRFFGSTSFFLFTDLVSWARLVEDYLELMPGFGVAYFFSSIYFNVDSGAFISLLVLALWGALVFPPGVSDLLGKLSVGIFCMEVVRLWTVAFAGVALPTFGTLAEASFFFSYWTTKSCVLTGPLILWAAGFFTIIPCFLASASLTTVLSPPAFALYYIDWAIGSSIPLRSSWAISASSLLISFLEIAEDVAAAVGLVEVGRAVFGLAVFGRTLAYRVVFGRAVVGRAVVGRAVVGLFKSRSEASFFGKVVN